MPPISGATSARSTMALVTEADHRGGALAVVEVADDGAADDDAAVEAPSACTMRVRDEALRSDVAMPAASSTRSSARPASTPAGVRSGRTAARGQAARRRGRAGIERERELYGGGVGGETSTRPGIAGDQDVERERPDRRSSRSAARAAATARRARRLERGSVSDRAIAMMRPDSVAAERVGCAAFEPGARSAASTRGGDSVSATRA